MQKSQVFWLLIVICLCQACTQKAASFDSLSQELAIAEIKTLSDSAWFNHVGPQKDLDEGSDLLFPALSKAQEIGDNYWQGDCYSQLSTIARLQYDFPLALDCGMEALYHRTLLDSALLIGRSQNNIGLIFKNIGAYDSAHYYFKRAIENYQVAGYPSGISRSQINIAETYNKQNQYKEAFEAAWEVKLDWEGIKYTDSLDLYTAFANIHLEVGTLDSAGFYYKKILNRLLQPGSSNTSRLKKVYHNLSGWAIQLNLYEIAKGYALERYKLSETENSGPDGENLHHLGIIYTELEQPEIAKKYLTKGEALFSAKVDTVGLAKLYFNQGEFEKTRKAYKKAEQLLRKCILLAKTVDIPSTEIEALNSLSEVYDIQKDYEASSKTRNSIIQIQYEVFALSSKALEFELLQNEKKQLRIESERSELTIWLLSLAIIAGIIFIGSIFMQIRSRRKFSQLERNFIMAREDGRQTERTRISDRLHDEVGALITVAIQQLDSISDGKALGLTIKQIASEVRNISKDLKSAVLANLGLKDAVQDLVDKLTDSAPPLVDAQFAISPESELDPYYEVQAFAMIKELLNNALKHAEADRITIYLTLDATHCEIMVEDNGIGIPQKMINNPSGQGIKSIQTRAKKLDANYEFDSHPQSGTSAIVTIPIKPKK